LAHVRVKAKNESDLNRLKMVLQASAIAHQMAEYYFFYGRSPQSFDELNGAGLAFLKPYNFYANRPAMVSSSSGGLQQGDLEIRSIGNAIYVGTVVDGQQQRILLTADPPQNMTVVTLADPFLSDPVNFKIWAAQTAAKDAFSLFGWVGSLDSLSELSDWGLLPFVGIGNNAITGGPILNQETPGNVVMERDDQGWRFVGIGRDGLPIPVA
jgi:hypothetical protein